MPVTGELNVVRYGRGGDIEGRSLSVVVSRYEETGALVMRVPSPPGAWDALVVRVLGETDCAEGRSYFVGGYFGADGEVDAHAVPASWEQGAPYGVLPVDKRRTPAVIVYGRMNGATVLRPRADGTIHEVPELVAFLLDLMAELYRRGQGRLVQSVAGEA